jgi:hypothetical protein
VQVEVESVRALRFDDGAPVRAASAIAPFGDGWLIAQDDSTFAAWSTGGSVARLRVLPSVEGLDEFSEREGTKHLKPDLEAACEVRVDDAPAVVLLGSGSGPARMRAVLVRQGPHAPNVVVTDLSPVYARAAEVLGIGIGWLNFEGACRVGETLRWFNRGNLSAGLPSASVDLDLATLMAAVLGRGDADAVRVGRLQEYELGEVEGVGLAVTDAVALGDGRILLSTAAEDTPNAVDDGPVVATALAVVDDQSVLDVAALPEVDGEPHKVEGLVVQETTSDAVRLLAVTDGDDPDAPSPELVLRVRW